MGAKRTFVDLDAAGPRHEYRAILAKIKKDAVCPFCPQNFKYHTRPILHETRHWLSTENFAPYIGTKHQFLLLHKKHIEHLTEMSPAAWGELLKHAQWLCKKYDLPAGSIFMRFGDVKYTNASVAHLHAQLLIGTKRAKKTFPIAPPLGFSTKPYIPKK
ncbi:hypothetical protein COU19_02315 [Candidatus Kaiserbacteria bacterium CG10_big_fil_rev_8_21_14_0_10_56_12]|uniref:Cwf19-like C-terminal domain-containing protein n=1 Tax=Candidatus Kaiserbacteria bacterium CG10_big_fil_rev_8_21_14_0_10_56_12 TaxID=1974611 RepID=A0A2H0UBF0_9BACT|nr:MAG: hypothetical protein COU19_02315 [Candidatus Kaiserbacteria bacterium CG10_big_fil_rev_8_21_14_0_10_56_12]